MNSFWSDRPVLVTGAASALGGHLVKRLIAEGAEVTCVVKDWIPHSLLVRDGLLAQVNVTQVDVKDQLAVERTLADYAIDTVFHLAPPESATPGKNLASSFEAHAAGTWALLEACHRYGGLSSIVLPAEEPSHNDSQGIAAIYEACRSCAETVAATYAAQHGVPVVATRGAQVFGPGDLSWHKLVPGTIRSVLRNQRPVTYGDAPLAQHFLYAEDAASAHLLMAEELSKNPELSGRPFAMPLQNELSSMEVVTRILRAMGSSLEPVVAREQRPSSPPLSQPPARIVGFEPRVDFDAGLRETIPWYERLLQRQARNGSCSGAPGQAA